MVKSQLHLFVYPASQPCSIFQASLSSYEETRAAVFHMLGLSANFPGAGTIGAFLLLKVGQSCTNGVSSPTSNQDSSRPGVSRLSCTSKPVLRRFPLRSLTHAGLTPVPSLGFEPIHIYKDLIRLRASFSFLFPKRPSSSARSPTLRPYRPQ